MASTDNPFASGSASSVGGESGPETLEPVAMDVMAIIERCWQIFTANVGLVLGAVLLPVIPAMIVGFAAAGLQVYAEQNPDTAAVATVARITLNLASTAFNIFIQLGVIRIFMNLARGQDAQLEMLVGGGPHFLAAVGTTILLMIALIGGFIALIIPGIILGLGLQFALYSLVDRDLDPISALTDSWELTNGYKLTIFAINLLIGIGMVVFTIVTCGIGYFVAIPVLSLTQAVMYHSLVHQRRALA